MALNTIQVNFAPCEPTPVDGYQLFYRRVGTSDFLRWPVNFTASPIVVEVTGPTGASYEGYLLGDCGDGKTGVRIPWTATNAESPQASSSAGGSSSSGESPAGPSELSWSFFENAPKNGRLQVSVNAGPVVDVTTTQTGSFMAMPDDTIDVLLSGFGLVTRSLTVTDTTTSTVLFFGSGFPNQSFSFAVVAGHTYSISGEIS